VNADGTEKQFSRSEPLSNLMRPVQEGHNLPVEPVAPIANPIIRCPMPPIGKSNVDSLRQFYKYGTAQFRVLTKP
jgi:hypothetical protein